MSLPDPTKARIPELDALRGLAAVGVVLHHAFPGWFSWGWACVDLFFVLSGYLITSIILAGGARPGFLKDFYTRRAARIWPVYFLTLGAVLTVNALSQRGYPTDGLWWHLAFLQNVPEYWGAIPPPFVPTFGPSWSVAVEEQFYLVWPLLILAVGGRRVWALAVAMFLACVLIRAVVSANDLLFTRGDGLAFGCFLAWLLRPERNRARVGLVFVTATGLTGALFVATYLAVYPFDAEPHWRAACFTGWAMLWVGAVGACVLWTGRPALAPLRFGPLRWLGTISYGLYMFHLPVMHYLSTAAGMSEGWPRAALLWAAIFALPAASWYLLERPVLRWQSRGAKRKGFS